MPKQFSLVDATDNALASIKDLCITCEMPSPSKECPAIERRCGSWITSGSSKATPLSIGSFSNLLLITNPK
jgi:hypothetical protein